MAAAYAALVSLSHILHNPPPTHRLIITGEEVIFLQEKVHILIEFLEAVPSRERHKIERLEKRIVDAAYEAEDIIESFAVMHIREQYAQPEEISKSSPFHMELENLREGMTEVIEKFSPILEDLLDIENRKSVEDTRPETSRSSLPGSKTIMVGFDDHLDDIKNVLASDDSSLLILPIVGMGGIGKTTLASNVYVDHWIGERFDVRAWVSVSQEYKGREMVIALLQQINSEIEVKELSVDELGLILHKELYRRRYLIVLDDIWDIQSWEQLKMFLPNNCDGSRIMVTTRIVNLAKHFVSCSPYHISLLDEQDSWDLICLYVFGKKESPIELEEIGRNIARGCGGLPLALVVIGGLLAKSDKTIEFWKYVEQKVTSSTFGDEQCLNILRLSYSELPVHLKPCFLYLAAFPKDFEIRRSRLIRLWVAEGFIKPSGSKSLEEVAEGCLEHLLDRNLIMISKRGHSGKVKSCSIHDLIREICVTEAEKNKFISIDKLDAPNNSLPSERSMRRLSVHTGKAQPQEKVPEVLNPVRQIRSFLSYSAWKSRGSVACKLYLLRVLDVFDSYTMDEIIWLINARYITCDIPLKSHVYSKIPMLWNLQTLVFPNPISLPSEFWKMPQLRHLKMPGITLAEPLDDVNLVILKNLQTLSTVKDFIFSENVLRRIPNVKKLGIDCKENEGVASFCLNNLASLNKLESLVLKSSGTWGKMAFPVSLKKLTLSHCRIPWDDMSVVGSLEHLEVLKLQEHATAGVIWNPKADEFGKLKFLLIDRCQLENWGADDSHFPSLEHLQLTRVMMLEFPDFAFIDSLRTVHLNYCTKSLLLSAKEMLKTREEAGGEDIIIQSFPTEEEDIVSTIIEMEFAIIDPQNVNANQTNPKQALSSREKVVVGYEDEFDKLKGYLLEETKEVDVISIVGMPGPGKYTLAERVFRDPEIQYEFPTRMWVHVPLEFSEKNIFLSILREFTRITKVISDTSDMELANLVAHHLGLAKFLLLIEGVCTAQDWDRFQIALPKNTNRGKVLITSCHLDVGLHAANRHRYPLLLHFITLQESRLLLQLEVFDRRVLEVEDESLISLAQLCDGLPLAIVIKGSILVKKLSALKKMTTANVQVYESFYTYLREDPAAGRRMYNVLSLCYKQLPRRLRQCFLYVGMFPEDFEIPTLKLIRMWIAEGFIRGEYSISQEETAEKYLDDLIKSKLLRLDKLKFDGKVKTCRVHCTVREFCRIEAANVTEIFFSEINMSHDAAIFFSEINMSRDGGFEPPVSEKHKYRRLCIHSNVSDFLSTRPYCPTVNSFVCFSKEDVFDTTEHMSAISSGFEHLRVLDINPFKIHTSSMDMYQLLHLRYLSISSLSGCLHADLSSFLNIQTLVVYTTQRTLLVETDILNLIELRHFKTNASAFIPQPNMRGLSSKGGEKIQTLGRISPESCTEEVFGRVKNLKKLGVSGNLALLLEYENEYLKNMDGELALLLKDVNEYLNEMARRKLFLLLKDEYPYFIQRVREKLVLLLGEKNKYTKEMARWELAFLLEQVNEYLKQMVRGKLTLMLEDENEYLEEVARGELAFLLEDVNEYLKEMFRGKLDSLLEDKNEYLRNMVCDALKFMRVPDEYLKEIARGKLDSWPLRYTSWPSFDSLGKLKNLEKLTLMNNDFPERLYRLPPAHKFPIKLRSLTLSGTYLDWRYMSVLGSLKNLEVLKLKNFAFSGRSWEATDGGFPHLQALFIKRTDLRMWVASQDHFPKLRRLKLHNCNKLEGVPTGLADVPSFQYLEINYCSDAAASSAKKIYEAKKKQEDQQFGNVHRFSVSIFPPLPEE